MDRAHAALGLTESDLGAIPVTADSDNHEKAHVEYDTGYGRVAFCANTIVATAVLAGDAVQMRLPPTSGCDQDNVDVMDYMRHDEYPDSRRFGTLSVEGQAMSVTVDCKLRNSVYVAWCTMQMSE